MKRQTVIANDTSGTSNPGCKGTVAGLESLLNGSDYSIKSRIPVEFGYALVKRVPAQTASLNFVARATRRLVPKVYSSVFASREDHSAIESAAKLLEREQWQKAVTTLADRFAPLWEDLDCLVVNGEGTIHHDTVGSRALLAICAAAKKLEKRVALVNCSIFELDDFLLEGLRRNVDDLAVREPVSFRYLQSHGIQSKLSADCLFLANEISPVRRLVEKSQGANAKPYVVYTPGVLSGSGRVGKEMVADDIRLLAAKGFEVFYYVVEVEDEKLAAIASQHGAKIIPLGGIAWQDVTGFLRDAELVISGRYHINIFAALAGTPFVPMETNTPKMRGLLELLGVAESHPIRGWGTDGVSPDALDLEAEVRVSPAALGRCFELGRKAVDGVLPP